MRLFGWWRTKRVRVPNQKIVIPEHSNVGNFSNEAVEQSKKKLKDARDTKKEVHQLIKTNDQFAAALQRAMRRTNG